MRENDLSSARAASLARLISLLCQAGDDERLTPKELVHFCILLLIAGNETTTNLLGNGLLALLDHPDQEAALRTDSRPAADGDRGDAALLPVDPRRVPADHAAVRDPRPHHPRRPAGHAVPGRRQPRRVPLPRAGSLLDHAAGARSLAFGNGIHFCLGSALARLEMRTMLAMLPARTSSWQLAGVPRITATPVVRGPSFLPLALTARRRA